MPAFRTLTLGCKVNQYETEYVREGLRRLGYREAAGRQTADLCVVNTCTVTAEGDLKSRKAIRQMARENPQAQIVVMGCYATRAPDEVAALPGVAEVITDKRLLPDFLARLGLVDVPAGISRFGQRHRAYVKVQDGCRMACAYCIIPLVRPELRSRPLGEVLEEIRRLVDQGYREIVLTGIHLGHYGLDLKPISLPPLPLGEGWGEGSRVCERRKRPPDCLPLTPDPSPARGEGRFRDRPFVPDTFVPDSATNLASLVGRIAELPGDFRLRLSSLEAAEVTPELIGLMAAHPRRICPHLHVSMQSGSDAVLERMRRAPAPLLVERCLAARDALDHPALTTDVIVGFPGETEADFRATCRAVEAVGFSKVHVFRFSPRQGTPAADMPEQVPGLVKRRRATELAELAARLRRRFMESLVGRSLEVLVETAVPHGPGLLAGTAERYVEVEFPGDGSLPGQLVRVDAAAAGPDRIVGETCCSRSGRRHVGD